MQDYVYITLFMNMFFVGYFHSILKEKCGIGIMSDQFEQSIVGFNSNKH